MCVSYSRKVDIERVVRESVGKKKSFYQKLLDRWNDYDAKHGEGAWDRKLDELDNHKGALHEQAN